VCDHGRYVIDGNKVVILREEVEHKVDDMSFEAGEVYAVDVAFSSGEGVCVCESVKPCPC
jgi:hypothetical protein